MKKSVFLLLLIITGGLPIARSEMLSAPLQSLSTNVPPNLMFTLDDSGSMNYQCLPELLCKQDKNQPVYTLPETINAGSTRLATSLSTAVFNRRMRSPDINRLYYDPKIRYKSWLKADGTRWPTTPASAARIFPELANTDTISLDSELKINTFWCDATDKCGEYAADQKIYLARYYALTSGDGSQTENFTEVNITAAGVYPAAATAKGPARTDCAGVSCTGAEELQNFSNWYTYHRSKMRVAIAGTSEAFYSVPENFRVGYGRINKTTASDIDGLETMTIEQGVRPFNLSKTGSKTSFYSWLAARTPDGGTPLRRAMGDVGQYYSYTDSRGPWGDTPGTTNNAAGSACRRSFHILMTDGLWGGAPAQTTGVNVNVDNLDGPLIKGLNGQIYMYKPALPYKDDYEKTLADVAMYYWNRDLNPSLDNVIPPTAKNPAFWQHMVNYTISFGVGGTLNPDTDLPALTAGTKKWPIASVKDDSGNIDDLWHAAINSRGRFLNASNSSEYADALKNIINEINSISGSESGVAVSAKAISASSAVRKYEPTFNSDKWSGDVEAINLSSTAANNGTAWRASEHFPRPAERNIVVFNSAATSSPKSLAFTWSDLTEAMKIRLYGARSGGENLLNFLRGERSLEGSSYRTRASVLGDIVNSAPVLVKDQFDGQYDFLPSTLSTQKASYRRFLAAKKLREAQLFVGANDGMLHAFSDSTGAESFGFVPDSVLALLKPLSRTDYTHAYSVDGPIAEADVYDSSADKWRNIIVAGLGAGAKALYAINVPVPAWTADASQPAALSASGSAPQAGDVLWEVSSASSGFTELGYQLALPEHGVMRSGSWVVIVGNGYDSSSQKAQLLIINALTGSLIKAIDTGVGSSVLHNGLGGVRLVRDSNKQIVAAYAGDLQGNMWKFDLSSADEANWNVAFGTSGPNGTNRNPLYKTATPEPITAAPTYQLHPGGGIMLLFGSGKLFETTDAIDIAQRALYGVWDKVALGSASSDAADRVTQEGSLVTQSLSASAITGTSGVFYALSVTPVDYSTKRGWRLPLNLVAGQRLVDDPELSVGKVVMQTLAPTDVTNTSCRSVKLLRHALALDPFMNAISQSTFDTNGDGVINYSDNASAAAAVITSSGPVSVVNEFGTKVSDLIGASGGGAGGGDVGNQKLKFQGKGNKAKRDWRQINQP